MPGVIVEAMGRMHLDPVEPQNGRVQRYETKSS